MANQVYANGREVSCKAAAGKSVAAFPDVCFTPPQTPATPPGVPVPYPNNGMASDATEGSTTVKISNKEIMLRDKSCFKRSTGDEAGSAPKKGVLTSKNMGKVYFASWSMDVKVEGQSVVRHLDMTTHNHASKPGNSPPWAYVDEQAVTPVDDCKDEVDRVQKACGECQTKEARCSSGECKACKEASHCLLVTYNQGKSKAKNSRVACCPGEQPHHLVEAHGFYKSGLRGQDAGLVFNAPTGKQSYCDTLAPCVCAEGPRHAKKHGQFHAFQGAIERAQVAGGAETWDYAKARDTGAKAQSAVNPDCSEKCTKAQLDAYHKDKCGMDDKTQVRLDPVRRSEGQLTSQQKGVLDKALDELGGVGGGE